MHARAVLAVSIAMLVVIVLGPGGPGLAASPAHPQEDLQAEAARYGTTTMLLGHWGGIESIAISQDGKLLATAGSDRTIRI